jgi:hypothetical protein
MTEVREQDATAEAIATVRSAMVHIANALEAIYPEISKRINLLGRAFVAVYVEMPDEQRDQLDADTRAALERLRALYAEEDTPRTIYCHVEQDGGVSSPGHMDEFNGLGWKETAEQAETLGWVNCGHQWTCPACANDAGMVTAFTVRQGGMGPVVFATQIAAAEFAHDLVENDEDPDEITITTEQVTQGYMNTLCEWDGF